MAVGDGWHLDVTSRGSEESRQSICALGSSTFTSYLWEVRNGVGHKWMVKKRYSDFVALDKVLTRRYPNAMVKISSIPGKTTWGSRKMDEAVVGQRLKSLHEYLKALCLRAETTNSQELFDFLEVPLEAALERDDDVYRGVEVRSGSPGDTELSTAPTSTSSIRVRAWQQEAEAKWGEGESLVF